MKTTLEVNKKRLLLYALIRHWTNMIIVYFFLKS